MKRKLTPQEKKRLSLQRDTVDAWGESQKGFRRTWPAKKARVQRAYRHAWAQRLHSASEPDVIDEFAVQLKPHGKWAGPYLGEWIADRQARRARLQAEPRKNPQARERRRSRRSSTQT